MPIALSSDALAALLGAAGRKDLGLILFLSPGDPQWQAAFAGLTLYNPIARAVGDTPEAAINNLLDATKQTADDVALMAQSRADDASATMAAVAQAVADTPRL